MSTVSVILPTYNRLAFLREAVESVFDQTYHDWELIVADDGSTDGTRDYLATLNHGRVRVLSLAHTGSPPKVRNAALAVARGTWVAFLDSDDLWQPSRLEIQLRSLADHPHCGWSCANIGLLDTHGVRIPQFAGAPYLSPTGWVLEKMLASKATIFMATLLVRRSLFEQVGALDERLSCRDDVDLIMRLAAVSQICGVADTLAFVRDHDGRTTRKESLAELHRQNVLVFRKAAQHKAIRRQCMQRCAIELVQMSRALSLEGQHRAALRSSVQAIRADPSTLRVWRGLAAVVKRAVTVRGQSHAQS
jgi:glycosyltransferase involved in cell wall biosynthesis